MRKIVIHRPGGYERLQLEEHPDLSPAPDQVLIDVEAIGVNYADCCVRWGVYESAKKYVGWPITPGFEVAGRVRAVGAAVRKHRVGDAVFGISRFGGYATQVALPEFQVFPRPRGFNAGESAGFPAVHMTAYHAIHQLVHIRAQGTVLIHSAAGGVGTALLQLAKIAGYRTVAVVGSSHKVPTAYEFGADVVIDKSQQELWTEAKRAAPEGYDAVFDANGAETLRKSYEHLAPTGKLISYGAHTLLPREGGRLQYMKLVTKFLQVPRFSPLKMISENRSVSGFNLSFLFERQDLMIEGLSTLLRWVDEGKLKPPKTTCFPLAEVAKAHRAIESAQSVGKLILTV